MEFTPGSVHIAAPVFSNPKSAGFDYQAVLCMGAAWTEMASASFHLDAGQSKSISFSVTMPTTLGTYPVYFKVSSGGVLIGTFVATEAVTIIQPPPTWVSVKLINCLASAEVWELVVADASETVAKTAGGLGDIPVSQAILFTDIPATWSKPFHVMLFIYKWNATHTALIQLYYLTSLNLNIGQPGYKPVYIPGFGDYNFNVATEQFEAR